jgi:hypothetical protein
LSASVSLFQVISDVPMNQTAVTAQRPMTHHPVKREHMKK